MERWMETYAWYSPRLQQVMMVIGFHELAQKGIIEDRPIPPISKDEDLEGLPANIVPTPLGTRLCSYFLTERH